jgi:hypothetical protein
MDETKVSLVCFTSNISGLSMDQITASTSSETLIFQQQYIFANNRSYNIESYQCYQFQEESMKGWPI